MQIMEMDQTYVANSYSRFPVTLTHGEGALLTDSNGKTYIDLGSGIAVNAFGVADRQWLEAVKAQLAQLPHASNLYYTEPCAKLAKMLCERTGMSRVFFGNSGAEANECMIKVARKWALDTYGEGHHTIITLKNSFHGRTIATLAATGQDAFHTNFGPFPAGFEYAEPNDLESVRAIAETTACAAVMLEVVQGEGGVVALDHDFLTGVEALCREKGMLLLIDEVQTGNGRSGRLYAYMAHGLKPDVVSTAKGIGGGLPLGVCMLGEKVKDTLTPGTHGSTFGGNPVVCAGALSILARLDEDMLSSVREKSAYIVSELSGAKGVISVDGMGLMLGIAVDKPAKELIGEIMRRGVLVLSAKTKIRLLPPINIPWEQLKNAIAIIKEVLAQ